MTNFTHVAGRVHADLASPDWWREAVIYQIYPKSWADSNGDGIGDLNGVRQNLPYLAELGVDAIWFSPFFVGPQTDGGYDVADYRDIDPMFGTLADAEALITEAHELGIKIIIDVVPNHTSVEHPFFKAAVVTPPGSPEWERYHLVRGQGENGELPPNDWISIFSGPAWTQTVFDGEPTGYWYLHIFDSGQPDVNWEHPDIVDEFDKTLRFWFDRGVDGFRIDVAHGLVKSEGYPSGAEEKILDEAGEVLDVIPHPYWCQDGVHAIYRRWREIANEYSPTRIFVGEIGEPTTARVAKYLRPDELHTGFNFGYLTAQWHPESIRKNVNETIEFNVPIGAPTTWVTDNHDTTRSVTRYGCEWPAYNWADSVARDSKFSNHYVANEDEVALGRRRARASMLQMLALPGSAYIYQGQELGLEEVRDIPAAQRQDPVFINSNGDIVGRDGDRVPMPWTRSGTSLGFGPEGGAEPWLPMPRRWSDISVEAQLEDPDSMHALTRTALLLRRQLPLLGSGKMRWRDDLVESDRVLAFERFDETSVSSVVCVTNFGAETVTVAALSVLIASQPDVSLHNGHVAIPADTTVWMIL